MNLKTIILFLHVLCVTNLQATFDALKIDNYLKNGNFNGTILITHHEKIILKKGYGYANFEYNIANTPQTKFLIASNTKSFTALAIMQLQEKKLLTIHDKLNKYIPDFPHGDTITIHHLLTHSSGIKNYYKQWADVCNCKNLEEMVTRFKVWDLEFEPGTRYNYSNSNYTLLAYIIEKVSGINYEEFLRENIFKPLGMNNTGSDDGKRIIKNKSYRYISENNTVINAPAIHNPITLLGNGDLYSCLDDMYLWNQALKTEKIITKKSIDTIFTQHFPMENSSTRAHGYGWFIDKKCNKKVIEFSGALIGSLSMIMKFTDDDVTIIIMTNVEDLNQFSKICDDLPKMLFNGCSSKN